MKQIKLDGVKNIRDISNEKVKPCCLIRSSSLENLTEEDKKILKEQYNVKTVINLMCDFEYQFKLDIPFAKCLHIPITNNFVEGVTLGGKHPTLKLILYYITHLNNLPDIKDSYIRIINRETKDAWTKIFDVLLSQEEGAVLWFCNLGKDRTGILSMLIEKILGYTDEEIMEDFLLTNEHIDEINNGIWGKIEKIPFNKNIKKYTSKFRVAKKEHLEYAISYIENEYGSIEGFLNENCGMDDTKIEMFKNKYLKK